MPCQDDKSMLRQSIYYNMAIPLKLLAMWQLAQLNKEGEGIELFIIHYIHHLSSDYVTPDVQNTAHVLNQALLRACGFL